ncbi:MAG: NAD-dependent epimerase/dehydratase family protein [Mariprofundaceae bacterium]|nr:NAD-dependent epimerase/dehydratase family protein [Mariprofundaceae bacterium]
MKTILLTGATGFLGSHLLEALLKTGYKVVILKRSTSNTWRIEHLLTKVKSYDVDCNQLEKSFADQHIDVVIHTACHYGRNGDSLVEIVESNVMFGLRVLDACIKYQAGAILNTDTLLQKNLNSYALSKKQFVEWLEPKSDTIQVVNLKLEHMYGPKDDASKFVSWLLSQLKGNMPEINLTSGKQMRDFIYIDDVVSAYITALSRLDELPGFSEYEVGTGCSITVKSFIQKLKCSYEAKFGKSVTTLNFGVVPLREGEVLNVKVDNSGLLDLGWKPEVSLKKGFENLLEEGK